MKSIATFSRLIPALAAGTALALVAGCPSQSSQKQSAPPPPTVQSAGFHGVAYGGRQPIVGATVVAYEQGLPPTELGSDVTDSNGQFNMTFSPTPATGQIVYVTAMGGNGGGSIGPNAAIGLMTIAGGYCTSGNAGCDFPDTVNINELTTVAATAVLKDYLSFGDCSTITGNTQSGQCPLLGNQSGIEHMARTFARLVNVVNGQASAFLAAASQTAGAPLRATSEKLDTLASILAACVNGAGPGDTKCTGLFDALLDSPTDTLYAAYEIASWPGITARAQTIYGLTPPTPIYSPVLTTAPTGIAAEFWNVGGDRYAFSANSGTGTISVRHLGGALDTVPGSPFTVSTDSAANSIAIDPSGHYAYVAVGRDDNDVSIFSIAADGSLTSVGSVPAGVLPSQVVVDPTGRYVYVANGNSYNVSAYTIGPGGTLTEVLNSPYSTGTESFPFSIAVDPSGQYVYVANFGSGSGTTGNNVSAFAIGPGGGLTEITGSPFPAGNSPVAIAVDPNGNYVYVDNQGDGNISAYAIGPGGGLNPVANSPFGTSLEVSAIAVDPNGRYLYATSENDNISTFRIGVDGALTLVAGSTVATGNIPEHVTVDPSGHYVYVTNFFEDKTVSAYSVGADGRLTEIAGSPFAQSNEAGAVTVDPSGRYVYVSNAGAINAYTVGSGAGLIPVTETPFAAGNGTYSVTVDPEGRYVYAANHGDGNVSAFLIADEGKLAQVAGSPFTAGNGPSSVVEDPSGRYVYVANNLGGGVSAYAIGASGALTEITGSPFTTGANPVAIAITPDGSQLFVANYSGSVSAFTIGAGGKLDEVAGSPFAAGIAPYSVAVDPHGQYVYVANSGGGDVSAYTIGSGGVLTDVTGSSCGSGLPSNCFAAGSSPRSLTVDLFGNVYVANYDDDDISVFSVGVGGVLTFIANHAAGDGPQSVTVTPDFYVYVTNSISNDISAYGTFFLPGNLYTLAGSPFPAGGTVPVSIVTGP